MPRRLVDRVAINVAELVLPGGLAVATPDATIGARIGFVAAHAAQNRGRYRQSADPRPCRPSLKLRGELVCRAKR